MWADRYSPKSINDIIGNNAQVNSLYEWLRDWDNVHIRGMKKELPTQNRGFNRGNW